MDNNNSRQKSLRNYAELKEILQDKEKKYKFKDDIFGMTLLTNPGYISSSRNIMFTSHLRQFVNLENPDFPRVFTNYENIVGKYSTAQYKAKNNLKVIDKIQKYDCPEFNNHLYLLFVYDEENDRYDVIQKKIVEDLTEKFGFSYNTEVMDSKDVGSIIKKDEILYKSKSYDENNNYCYGKNAKFMYLLENNTIEDAIIVSESFANNMISKEVETVRVSLNDNDIFCNIYGDDENYKCFPDVNEFIKDRIVCAKRRIYNDQLLYDVKRSNLRKINFSSDQLIFCEGRIVDIMVYCNKPLSELPDNEFNSQILKYLRFQEEYYKRIYKRCKEIKESGSEYSQDINFLYQKAKNYLDDNYKWREEDHSVFNHIVIEFLVERNVGLSSGQKLSARYGNKGVISKIVPDEEMPYLETGERVDVLFNSLGVINRLNSFQLYEQSITFICNRVRDRIKTMTDLKEKEKLLFRTIELFNEDQMKKLKEYYNKLPKKKKEEFFKDIETNGIFIHIPPLWETKSLFDRLKEIYEEFDWIKPYDIYVNKFGRQIKLMKPLIVGDMYLMKLKQTSKKGFSVRSTGSLSKKGIPEKSNKAKTHQELYSKTPIRFGIDENINSVIGVNPELVAKKHLYYRSSVTGRRFLGEKLMSRIKELKDFGDTSEAPNRNVEILQAYFKAMGLKLEFDDDYYTIKIYNDTLNSHDTDSGMYICTDYEFEKIKKELKLRKKYKDDYCFVGSIDEFEKFIDEKLKDLDKYVIDIDI